MEEPVFLYGLLGRRDGTNNRLPLGYFGVSIQRLVKSDGPPSTTTKTHSFHSSHKTPCNDGSYDFMYSNLTSARAESGEYKYAGSGVV
jgi:hypothetical protein